MDNISKFQTQHPEAWSKIAADSAFQTGTELSFKADGSVTGIANSSTEAITAYLSSIPDHPQSEIKGQVRSFFHWNKLKGSVAPPRSGYESYFAIEQSEFLKKSKAGLVETNPMMGDDPSVQDHWEQKQVRKIQNGEFQTVVFDHWQMFSSGSPMQWCFEVLGTEATLQQPQNLNCRLSLRSNGRSQSWFIIKMAPLEKRHATFLDGGSEIYANWLPGGKTAVSASCNNVDKLTGMDEFVFEPSQLDALEMVVEYSPCVNWFR